MEFFDRIKSVLFHPQACWDEIGKEEGISKAIKYFLILTLISIVIYCIVVMVSFSLNPDEQTTAWSVVWGVSPYLFIFLTAIIYFLILFVSTFLNSGLRHFFIKLFKGTGSFSETYKAVAYGTTPFLLLLSIPIIGNLSGFYMLALQFIGLSKLHRISYWRVFFAMVLADIILLLIIFATIFIFALTFMRGVFV